MAIIDLCQDILRTNDNNFYVRNYSSFCVDKNEELHSENDMPARVDLSGDLSEWFFHGMRHRKNNPAFISSTEIKYFRNGELHRSDGPAHIIKNNKKEEVFYYLNGQSYSYAEYYKLTGKFDNCTYLNGKLHSLNDKPAVVGEKIKQWYKNGKLHRVNAPAEIFKIKNKEEYRYCLNGRLHRTNGPAIINNDTEVWYRNGINHRLDGPAIVNKNPSLLHTKYDYVQNGKLHRKDGPARIYYSGRQEYYLNGKLHRLDGPAIEHKNIKAFFIDDVRYSEKDYWRLIKNPGLLNFQ